MAKNTLTGEQVLGGLLVVEEVGKMAMLDSVLIPFGMLFVEGPADRDVAEPVVPDYDPREAISFVFDSDGQRVPFVTWSRIHLGTKTSDDTTPVLDTHDTD